MSDHDPRLRPTLVTCPDCSGVLSVREEAGGAYLELVCQVGHTYSLEKALKTKENQLENTLWTTLVLLKHIVLLCEEGVRRHPEMAADLSQRADQARAHEQALLEVIQATKAIAFPGEE